MTTKIINRVSSRPANTPVAMRSACEVAGSSGGGVEGSEFEGSGVHTSEVPVVS